MHKLLVPTSETAKTMNFGFIYPDFDWNASPPSSLTIDEALRIFVEGMEFANDTQQKAIEGAFNCNLQVVLDAAKVWFEELKIAMSLYYQCLLNLKAFSGSQCLYALKQNSTFQRRCLKYITAMLNSFQMRNLKTSRCLVYIWLLQIACLLIET